MQQYHMQKAELEIKDETLLLEILKMGRYTTIALCKENAPYVLTLSYGYDPDKHALYFHTALKGLKLDYIRANSRVCATVIEDKGYQHGRCSHAYRSLIMWGHLTVVEELIEKKHGMEIMLAHLEEDPDPIRDRNLKNDRSYDRVIMLRLDIQSITGKEGT